MWRRRIRTAASLPPRDWVLLAEALLALTIAAWVMRVTPRRHLARVMQSTPPAPPWPRAATAPVLRALDRAAAVHPHAVSCLDRAVASRWLLAWHAHGAALVLGTRAGTFAAHAWLELDGCIADPANRYTSFTPIWRHGNSGSTRRT